MQHATDIVRAIDARAVAWEFPRERARRFGTVAAVVAVLAVLVAGGLLGRMLVMQEYYVSADAGQVVIFQGVPGEVLGVPLHSVAERTDIALDDLPETERSQVRDGIPTENGLVGARGLVDRLRDRMLEPCPPPQPPQPVEALPPAPPVTDPNVPLPPPVDTTPLPTPVPLPGTTCRSVS
jgi:protein phosphatase